MRHPILLSAAPLAAVLAMTLAACGEAGHARLKEGFDPANNPALMGVNRLTGQYEFNNRLAELPLAGKLTRTSWSGGYWPSRLGGIAFRWNAKVVRDAPADTDEASPEAQLVAYHDAIAYPLVPASSIPATAGVDEMSPAEKYDLYLGAGDFPLTTAERERTQVLRTIQGSPSYTPGFDIAYWEGLCHAWAPATIYYDAMDAVTVTGALGHKITFGASDLQALLTYFLHVNLGQTPQAFLSSRCDIDENELRAMVAAGQILPPACRDSNPGALHIVLANEIGVKNEGLIADIVRGAEVWNQGIVGYQSRIVQDLPQAWFGSAPGTVREVLVATSLYYITETGFALTGKGAGDMFATENLLYWLELDAWGNIIGGSWSDPNEEHPDFVWKFLALPAFSGTWQPLEGLVHQATDAYRKAHYPVDVPF